MDPTTATLAAAVLALVGALVAAAVALLSETTRRKHERQADELKELRAWTSRVFEHLFELQHETEWLTWHALKHPASIDELMVKQYEAAVHTAYPKVLGAMSVVASMDAGLFNQLWVHVDAVYEFEGRVAEAALLAPQEQRGALAELAAMNAEAKGLYLKLPGQLAGAMAAARVQPIR